MDLGLWYTRFVGVVFFCIAAIMLVHPQANLSADGIDINSLPVAGRAEVRAWYVGTALTTSWTISTLDTRAALQAIAIVLGGFASSRVVTYAVEGVDANLSFALHQNMVFGLEVAGSVTACVLHSSRPPTRTSKSSTC